MAESLQQWAYGIQNKYIGQIEQMLGLSDPGSIQITFKPSLPDGAAGITSGTDIQLSREYYAAHPEDVGGVIHELTHAVLHNFNGPLWLSEGLADYTRDKLGDPSPNSSTSTGDNISGGDPRSGALFLQWLNKVSPGSVTKIAQAATSGQQFDVSQLHPYMQAYQAGVTAQEAKTQIQNQGNPSAGSGSGAGSPSGGSVVPDWTGGGTGSRNGGEKNDVLNQPSGGGNTGSGSGGNGTQPPKPTTNPGKGMEWAYINGQWMAVPSPATVANEKANKANAQAAFEQQLQQWGIPLDNAMQNLVQNAVQNGWSTTRFVNQLEQTDAFQQEFPGIFAQDGTLKMSPDQYLNNRQAYQDAGSRYGIDVGQGKLTYLFSHNVSPSEFADRATAFQRLRDNPQLLQALNQQAAVDGTQAFNEHDLFKGIMGEGNKEFYQTWQNATTRYQAEQAGFQIGKAGQQGQYNHLGEHLLGKVQNAGLTEAQAQQDFQQMADTFLSALPASRIAHYGLSRGEIERAVVGGQGQAEIRQKIQHIMDQEQAMNENTLAASQSYVGQGGRLGVAGNSDNRGATE